MLGVSPGMKLKYDMKSYMNYAEKLIEKCNSFAADKENEDEEEENGFRVTPFVLGECLWTDIMIGKLGDDQIEDVIPETKGSKDVKGKNIKRKAIDDDEEVVPRKKRKMTTPIEE